MRVINRFASAYRRVSQSRICTTVLRLAQTVQWGWGESLKTASANQMISHLKDNIIANFVYKVSVAEELHQL
jgi:hypothetical protein